MGRSWGDLGASWDGLGASWGDLGASGGDLGASGAGLGASWSGLLGTCWHKVIFHIFLDGFWIDLEAQMDPQRSPNGAQNDAKSNIKIMMKYEGFQIALGSVLGPSWAVLGSIFGSKIIKLFALRESRRGAWRQALGGSEAVRLGSSEAPIRWSCKFLGSF